MPPPPPHINAHNTQADLPIYTCDPPYFMIYNAIYWNKGLRRKFQSREDIVINTPPPNIDKAIYIFIVSIDVKFNLP